MNQPRSNPDPTKYGGQVTAQAKTRINEEIRVRQVRLIDDKGGQLGVIDTQTAMDMAREKGLDLVEVAPEARPPVCKLLDFGKQKYLQKKKENEARKKQHQVVIKEVRVRPKIDTHDLQTKMRKARQFLGGGDKLQVNMLFRGREHGFRERGLGVMIDIRNQLSDISKAEREPKMEGNRLVMILQPLVSKSQVKNQQAKDAEKARREQEKAEQEKADQAKAEADAATEAPADAPTDAPTDAPADAPTEAAATKPSAEGDTESTDTADDSARETSPATSEGGSGTKSEDA